MIDVIDHDNFGYDTQAGDAMRGAFDWEMYYKRIPIPPELRRDDPSEPFEWVKPHLTLIKSYCLSVICWIKSERKWNLHFVKLIFFHEVKITIHAVSFHCQLWILKVFLKLSNEWLTVIPAFLFWKNMAAPEAQLSLKIFHTPPTGFNLASSPLQPSWSVKSFCLIKPHIVLCLNVSVVVFLVKMLMIMLIKIRESLAPLSGQNNFWWRWC